jgi:hypothetical protein
MSQGGGGGQKSAKKVSRIIWMAPYVNLEKLTWNYKVYILDVS